MTHSHASTGSRRAWARGALAGLCAAACLMQAAPALAADPVQRFNGNGNRLTMHAGARANVTGAVTIAALVKPRIAKAGTLVALHTSARAESGYALRHTATGEVVLSNGSTSTQSSRAVLAANVWQLIVATKASGSVTPRFHVYNFATRAWTHVNGSVAVGNGGSVAGGTVWLGARAGEANAANWDGDYAAAAIFPSALADLDVETLDDAYGNWLTLSPGAMWILNQPQVYYSVLDETRGDADEHLDTTGGTTVIANASPFSGDPDTTIFRGDFSTGSTNQWWDEQLVGSTARLGVASASPAPPTGESHYGRFQLGSGDERAEVYHGMQMGEGEDAFIRFLVQFESGFPVDTAAWGQIFWQLHHERAGGSPPIALVVNPDGRITLEDQLGGEYWNSGTRYDTGTWHEYVINVKHSTRASDGYVQLWVDGVQQTLRGGVTLVRAATLLDTYNYPKAGYYRHPIMTAPGSLLISGYRIARTYSDAQP